VAADACIRTSEDLSLYRPHGINVQNGAFLKCCNVRRRAARMLHLIAYQSACVCHLRNLAVIMHLQSSSCLGHAPPAIDVELCHENVVHQSGRLLPPLSRQFKVRQPRSSWPLLLAWLRAEHPHAAGDSPSIDELFANNKNPKNGAQCVRAPPLSRGEKASARSCCCCCCCCCYCACVQAVGKLQLLQQFWK